ncbi:MAG: hypothetical protein ACREQ9_01750 [Candidatus Binatia bacterium]
MTPRSNELSRGATGSTGCLVATIAVAMLAIPSAGRAQDSTPDTLLYEQASGTLEITPGLCAAGDPPGCVGPYRAQWRLISETCTISGRFEGVDLPADTPCQAVNHGFTFGKVQGWLKPVCGETYSYTSEHTTWDDGSANTHTIGGVVRNEALEVPANGGGVLIVTGWLDGDDADDDPVGDISIFAELTARAVSEPGTVACVTAPATNFTFTSQATFVRHTKESGT